MGTSHIFYLYDDALSAARDDPAARDRLALDLGRALLGLTVEPDFLETGEGSPERVTWRRVGSHGNALHWCDEVHSREMRVYVWAGNCLRELGALDEPARREVARLIESLLQPRRPGGR